MRAAALEVFRQRRSGRNLPSAGAVDSPAAGRVTAVKRNNVRQESVRNHLPGASPPTASPRWFLTFFSQTFLNSWGGNDGTVCRDRGDWVCIGRPDRGLPDRVSQRAGGGRTGGTQIDAASTGAREQFSPASANERGEPRSFVVSISGAPCRALHCVPKFFRPPSRVRGNRPRGLRTLGLTRLIGTGYPQRISAVAQFRCGPESRGPMSV